MMHIFGRLYCNSCERLFRLATRKPVRIVVKIPDRPQENVGLDSYFVGGICANCSSDFLNLNRMTKEGAGGVLIC